MRSGGSDVRRLGPIALTQIKAEVHLGDQNYTCHSMVRHMSFTPLFPAILRGHYVPRRGASDLHGRTPTSVPSAGSRSTSVDATGLAQAMILRIQTLLLPIQTLVLAAHWPLVQR